jgi:hypothetical protein
VSLHSNVSIDEAFVISIWCSLCLSAFALTSILTTGVAASLGLGVRSKGMPFVGVSVALGILIHALIGFLVSGFGDAKQAAAVSLLALANMTSLAVILRFARGRLSADPSLPTHLCVAALAWFCLTAVATVGSRIATKPDSYASPLYVFKTDVLSTRIQALTGPLPADNAIPHVVAEFLLRDISFKAERPIMPGQEVTNRPFLMSFVVVPFRAAFDAPPLYNGRLGRFQYVGTDWPDISPLLSDETFSQFLAIAILLNATLVVGVLWVLSLARLPPSILTLAVATFMTSHFVLNQTLFTWPKSFCAYWVIAALMAVWRPSAVSPFATMRLRDAAIAGACLGVAYWCHPLALVFTASLFLVQSWAVIRYQTRHVAETLLATSTGFAAIIAPWVIWSRLVVCIPSDLLAQNLGRGPLWQACYVRLCNIYHVIVPACFDTPPLSYQSLLATYWLSLPASIGLLLLSMLFWRPSTAPAVPLCGRLQYTLAFFILPWLLICISFGFSNPVCLLHGFQFHVAVGVAFTVAALAVRSGRSWRHALIAVLCLQVLCNVTYTYAKLRPLAATTPDAAVASNANLLRHSSLEFQNPPLPPHSRVNVAVAGETRECIWFNAPATATVGPVPIKKAAGARVLVAIHEHVWPIIPEKGIDFRLIMTHHGDLIGEESVNVSPATRSDDRRWVPLVVRCPIDSPTEVIFTLDVGQQPMKGNIDWCLWSGLTIFD